MEPEGRYTLIGTLVLLLAATAIAALVWLSGYTKAGERSYTIFFERQSLRGLQVGGEVNIRGLKVGQVTGYSILPSNVNRVKVNIRIDAKTPVSDNTTAVIGRNLVTGVARIDLETPNPPGPLLVASASGEQYPVIAEGSSEFDVISDAFNRIALTGEATLRNLNALLADENTRAFSQTIAAVRDLATGLNRRLELVDGIGADLRTTATALQGAGERIAGVVERTSGALTAQVGPIAAQTATTLREIQLLVGQTRQAVDELAQAAGQLEKSSTQAIGKAADAADQGLLEFRVTARDLRSGLDSLGRTLDSLQDPRSLLLGPADGQLGPGERRR